MTAVAKVLDLVAAGEVHPDVGTVVGLEGALGLVLDAFAEVADAEEAAK